MENDYRISGIVSGVILGLVFGLTSLHYVFNGETMNSLESLGILFILLFVIVASAFIGYLIGYFFDGINAIKELEQKGDK